MHKAGLFVVAAVVLLAFIVSTHAVPQKRVGDQKSVLAQTAAAIQAQKQLSAATIGVTLAGHIDFVFQQNSLTVAVINVNINNNELVVSAKTTVWNGATVVADFTFFFPTSTATDLEMQIELQITGFTFQSLYSTIFAKGQAQLALLNQLKTTTTTNVVFVYSTVAFNGQQQGVTLSAVTTFSPSAPSSGPSLLQAFRTLKPSAVAGSSALTTNVYVRNAEIFSLSVQDISSTGFSLAADLHCESYAVNVNVMNETVDVLLNAAFTVALNSENVEFAVSSSWASSQRTFSFTGTLQSAWTNAFGFSWLSLSSATLNVAVGPSAAVTSIQMNAAGVVSFGTSAPASLTVDADATGNFLISLTNVPLGAGAALARMYTTVTTHQAPAILSELTISSGQVSIAISNYASGNVKKGLDLSADVTVAAGGTVSKALSVLSSSASRTYDLDLFLPIFSAQSGDIALTLKESGSFALSNSVSVADYKLQVNIAEATSASSFSLAAELAVAVEQQTTALLFDVSTSWQQTQPTQVDFTGSLQGAWPKPFGVSWLTIDTATLTLVVQGGSSPATLTVAATGSVAWASSGDASITVDIDSQTGGFLVSASGIPFGGANAHYGNIYSAVTGAAAPAVLSQLESASGTVGFSLATYSSGNTKEGFTFTADVSLASGSELDQATRAIDSQTTTRNYALNLFVPVFSQQPQDLTFSLQETGAIALSAAVSCDGYQIQVAVQGSDSFSLSATTEASVTIKEQTTPVVFDLSGQWQSTSSQFQFTGSLKAGSTWTSPFGLSWMTISAANVALTVGASTPVDTFSITATADLLFSTSSAVTVVFNVKGDGNVMFSVNNLPLSSLAVMFITITEGAEVPRAFVGVNTVGTVSVAVSTYAGSVKEGFTLTGSVTLAEGQMLTVAKDMNQAASSATYQFSFFSPIFGPAPAYDVDISLTETGSFQIGSITCESYTVTADISSTVASFTVASQVSIPLSHQPTPVVFAISGGWQEQSGVTFTGALVGTWANPFGASWLTIDTASVSLAVKGASLLSLSFTGSGAVGTGSETVDASFGITTSGSAFTLTASVESQWSFGAFAKMVTGQDVPLLDDAQRSSNELDFSITLASTNGLTFSSKGTLQGGLLKHAQTLSPGSSSINSNLVFDVSVNIPVFTDPADITLSLSVTENIAITQNFAYENMTIALTVDPLAISASVDFQATFTKNPTLNFDLGGTIGVDGSFTFTGDMIGSWDNVFGFKYFDLSNVILEFGVDPEMCAVDFCISDVGLGCEMQLGTKTIKFDGNAAAPDFEDMYLAGSVTGSDGMALSVMDIVLEWNSMFPSLAIPTADVPQNWGISNTAFFFAPVDGHFGNIYYSEGFGFTGGIQIIDLDLDISVNCTDKTADWCDFAFNVNIDLGQFSAWVKHELGLKGITAYTFEEAEAMGMTPTDGPVPSDPNLVVFRVNGASLSQWSASNIAHNQQPHWLVDIDVWNKNHILNFDTELSWLGGSFHSYFDKWLEWLFHI